MLPRKISQAYTPILDPSYRGFTWYMLPCGEGVNRLSPSDSFLAGSRDSEVTNGALTGHPKMGRSQIGRVVKGDPNGQGWKTLFWSVPLPEGDMTAEQIADIGGEPMLMIGCWYYVTAEDVGKEVKLLAPISIKGRPRSSIAKTFVPRIPGWQVAQMGFFAQKGRDTATVVDIGLQVSGPALFSRPFLHRTDAVDPFKIYDWRAGEGAYRVLVRSAQRWTYSLNVDLMDLELVEMSQSFSVR